MFKMMKKVMFLVMMLSVWAFSAHDIVLGETVEGAWTEESPKGGETNRAKEYYTFTLTEETNVVIISNSELHVKLHLYDSENNFIKQGKNVRSQSYSALVAILEPGKYTIDVSTYWGTELGNFELSIKHNKITTHSISLNTTVNGKWTEDSGRSISGGYIKEYYTFMLTEETDIAITLDTQYHGQIRLYDSENNRVKKVRDYGSYTRLAYLLEAGTYTIDVRSIENKLGDFTLNLEENKAIEPYDININSTVESAWTEESRLSIIYGRAIEYYTFTLTEKTNVAITLNSSLDESLALYDSDNNYISIGFGYANNEGKYSDSRLITSLEAGTYIIKVTTYEHETTSWRHLGDFTLSLREISTQTDNKFTSLNTIENGAWSLDSKISSNRVDSLAEYYTFTITTSTIMTIDLTSSVDTYLYLMDDEGKVIASNDDGSGTNSRIEIQLDAGTYKIEAAAYYLCEGNFQLDIKSQKDYSYLIPIYGLLLP